MKKKENINKSQKKPVVVAVSGYFNPLHVGHLDMIEKARKLGDKLVVIVNNDKQVALKGRVPFMSEKDRVRIISALRGVDKVVLAIDDYKIASGEVPVIKSLAKLRPNIFANGGDRHSILNVPEFEVCEKYHIKMVDGLGKKIRASSIMIREAAEKRELLEKKLLKIKK
ncbi:MAG: adenylyltransferase/cytidyltransferase family protein [Patescibacteria group bacterium]